MVGFARYSRCVQATSERFMHPAHKQDGTIANHYADADAVRHDGDGSFSVNNPGHVDQVIGLSGNQKWDLLGGAAASVATVFGYASVDVYSPGMEWPVAYLADAVSSCTSAEESTATSQSRASFRAELLSLGALRCNEFRSAADLTSDRRVSLLGHRKGDVLSVFGAGLLTQFRLSLLYSNGGAA